MTLKLLDQCRTMENLNYNDLRHDQRIILTQKIKKMEFRNHYNTIPDEGKTFTQKSETVPNMALSIREMQERFARGQEVPVRLMTPQEVVDGDYFFTKTITDLTDIDEREQRLEQLTQKLADIKAKMQEPKEPAKTEEPGAVPENTEPTGD